MSKIMDRFKAPGIIAAAMEGEAGCESVGDERWHTSLYTIIDAHDLMISSARSAGWEHEPACRRLRNGRTIKEPSLLRTIVECDVGSPSVGKVLVSVETIGGNTFAVAVMSSSAIVKNVRRMIRQAIRAAKAEDVSP